MFSKYIYKKEKQTEVPVLLAVLYHFQGQPRFYSWAQLSGWPCLTVLRWYNLLTFACRWVGSKIKVRQIWSRVGEAWLWPQKWFILLEGSPEVQQNLNLGGFFRGCWYLFELLLREKAKVKVKARTETKFTFGKINWNDLTEKTKQNKTKTPLLFPYSTVWRSKMDFLFSGRLQWTAGATCILDR